MEENRGEEITNPGSKAFHALEEENVKKTEQPWPEERLKKEQKLGNPEGAHSYESARALAELRAPLPPLEPTPPAKPVAPSAETKPAKRGFLSRLFNRSQPR